MIQITLLHLKVSGICFYCPHLFNTNVVKACLRAPVITRIYHGELDNVYNLQHVLYRAVSHVTYTRRVRHLVCSCAQGHLNYFLHPTLVLTLRK
jgi:hypothetical protein